MKGNRKYLFAVLFVAVLTALDQWTKHLAVRFLSEGPIVLIDGVFELNYITNRGMAFGLFQGRTGPLLILTVALVAILTWIFVRVPEEKRFLPLQLVLLGLIAGGIGNIIDRWMNGYVVDFLYFKLINFPIFNVADIYATVSAFLLFFLGLFHYGDEDFQLIFGQQEKGQEERKQEESSKEDKSPEETGKEETGQEEEKS